MAIVLPDGVFGNDTFDFRSKYGKWQIFSLITENIQQLLSLKNLRDFDVPVVDKKQLLQLQQKKKKLMSVRLKLN